jgi:hypothetical protein
MRHNFFCATCESSFFKLAAIFNQLFKPEISVSHGSLMQTAAEIMFPFGQHLNLANIGDTETRPHEHSIQTMSEVGIQSLSVFARPNESPAKSGQSSTTENYHVSNNWTLRT